MGSGGIAEVFSWLKVHWLMLLLTDFQEQIRKGIKPIHLHLQTVETLIYRVYLKVHLDI